MHHMANLQPSRSLEESGAQAAQVAICSNLKNPIGSYTVVLTTLNKKTVPSWDAVANRVQSADMART